MARKPRFTLPDLPQHVVQRGNNRQRCFFEPRDYGLYLRALREASMHYAVLIHAYVLMTNHVHLLLTPRAPGGIARLMQSVAARYVWHVNARRDRTGTLWEGRYKACLVARDEHILAACRYIDLNPVRAGMVEHPSEYRWSSYAALSEERHDPLVTPHDTLLALGLPRGPAYERWCAQGGNDEATRQLREATGRELAFGPDSFKSEIEALTMRPASAKKRGRRSHRESPPS